MFRPPTKIFKTELLLLHKYNYNTIILPKYDYGIQLTLLKNDNKFSNNLFYITSIDVKQHK